MTPLNSRNIIGLPIVNETMETVINAIVSSARKRQKEFIVVASCHVLVHARLNEFYRKVLERANLILPDGKPISVLMNWLYGTKQERIAGMDLLPKLLDNAEKEGLPVFFWVQRKTFLLN